MKTVWNLPKGISDLTLLDLKQDDVDMKLDTPDRSSGSDAEKVLVNNFYAYANSHSRAAVLKRLTRHETKLVSLIDISDASAELPNDLNVEVDDASFSVRKCLGIVLKGIRAIQKVFEESNGSFDNMSRPLSRN